MSEINVEEIKLEAMTMIANGVRGQHSNNKVIMLCKEIARLQALAADSIPRERVRDVLMSLYNRGYIEDHGDNIADSLAAALGVEVGEK